LKNKILLPALSLTIALISLFTVQDLSAQPRFQGGINFEMGFPQGDFESNVDNVGFGLGLDFAVFPKLIPFGAGASFTFLNYGNETRREPFSLTIPDVTVEVETQNSIVQGFFILRLQPNAGFIRPYMDGLFGFSYLFTETKIKDESDLEEIASSTNFDDFTYSYGAGGGVMIQVFDGTKKLPADVGFAPIILIDLRIRYLIGGEAEYLKEGSITRENGQLFYDVSKSDTDLMTLHIGVVLEF
jgi:hypothetical protein